MAGQLVTSVGKDPRNRWLVKVSPWNSDSRPLGSWFSTGSETYTTLRRNSSCFKKNSPVITYKALSDFSTSSEVISGM